MIFPHYGEVQATHADERGSKASGARHIRVRTTHRHLKTLTDTIDRQRDASNATKSINETLIPQGGIFLQIGPTSQSMKIHLAFPTSPQRVVTLQPTPS